MKNSTKAKIIVDEIRRSATSATSQYINAEADLVKAQTGFDLWEKSPENDLGWNPYNVEIEEKTVVRKLEEKAARDEVLAYAIHVFLDKIPE